MRPHLIIAIVLLVGGVGLFIARYNRGTTPAAPTSLAKPDWPPLARAVAQGNVGEVRSLLASGADPNVRASGEPILSMVWISPGTEAAELLAKAKVDLNPLDSRGFTPLMIVTFSGRSDVAHVLIDAGADVKISDRTGRTALSFAAEHSTDPTLIQKLVARGANIDQRSGALESTPLMLAANSGNVEVVEAMLAAGAAVEAKDANDETAAFYAVRLNRDGALRALAKHGADLQTTGTMGPLVALAMSPGRDDCLKVLRDAGVPIPPPNPAVNVGRPNPATQIR